MLCGNSIFSMSFPSVFVTVGTTKFDALLEVVDSLEFQEVLRDRFEVSRLTIQCGSSKLRPASTAKLWLHVISYPLGKVKGVSVETFDFRPNLLQLIHDADLVISHCGAGSVLEILRCKKKAVGVVNPALLDNHQVELADAMERGKYMVISQSPSTLLTMMKRASWETLREFEDPKPSLFQKELNTLIRFA